MERIITYSIVATLVSIAVPFFSKGRNFYFFPFLVILVGLIIAFWANCSSEIDSSDYAQHDVFIEHAVFDHEEERLDIFADGKKLLLSKQSLSRADIAVIEEAAPTLYGNATIWLQPNSNLISEVKAPHLSIDPRAFAEREASLYSRSRNVGFVISIIGLAMILFNYFTRSVNTDMLLTRKY